MAVFQKVPPEILRHILELGAEDEKGLGGRDLCSTALVARTWSQPAQELLVYKFWSSRQPNAPEYIDSTFPSRSVRAITLSTPTPRHNSAAKAHRLIERHGTRLEEVVIGSQVPSAEIAFILAHGMRTLGIVGDIRDDVKLPDGIQLPLESLTLLSGGCLPEAFLSDLFDKSPRLTRLVPRDDVQLPVITLAPRLTHLVLGNPISNASGADHFALQACTSLRSLKLVDIPRPKLGKILSLVPSQLVVLHTNFHVKDPHADERVGKALLGALDQPALAKLKRWRWGNRAIWSGQERIVHADEVVESWEAACRARGIEPRGEENYYTD